MTDSNQKKKKDFWEKLNCSAPIINTFIVIGFGLFVQDSIERAFKERQLQVSSGQAMQELIERLISNKTTTNDFRAASHALAAFGPYAALPLVKSMDTRPNIEQQAIAADALLFSALSESKPACEALRSVIGVQSKIFHWRTHQSAIKLIGNLKCKNSDKEIEDYWNLVLKIDVNSNKKQTQLVELKKRFRDGGDLGGIAIRDINDFVQALCRTRENLEGLKGMTLEGKKKCSSIADS